MNWQDRKNSGFLGKTVTVQVDRPIGCQHGDIRYPINYGFLPGVMGGDGEEQDAYIYGVDTPVDTFTGRVIAVIRRHDDCEDKLVVAPEGVCPHQAQISEAVHFLEQYFDISIDALYQKSCGVAPFRHGANGLEFLILFQNGSRTWSFPKGHMEPGETEQQTALRELFEETGLETKLIPGAKAVTEYPIGPISRKQVVLFAGEVRGEPALRDGEIESCRWVCPRAFSRYLYPGVVSAMDDILNKL